jgi:ADP-heptose:LPS heptosyltransferase
MILKADCIYFPGDRPCKPHKTTGVLCPDCNLYTPMGFRILIIKLDAIGDVLRTTSILHSLKKKYPDSYIVWLTKNNAKDLFKNNELVNEIFVYENIATETNLDVEEFDLVINLDPSPVSAALATKANGKKKIGFGLKPNGKVFTFNDEAIEWFEMGAFDNLKKANTKTYQQIIHEICSLDYDKGEIIVKLNDVEQKFSDEYLKNLQKYNFDIIIGINPGASDRWEFKKWREDGYIELINKIQIEYNACILLYGGDEEKKLLEELSSVSKNIINTGSNNSLRQFIALMNVPQIFITGDTLALHIATALKKEVICLFGPTSYNEIEDYGRITKVVPYELECLVCYKMTCDFVPNCMQVITADMVYEQVKHKINKIKNG